MLSQTYDNWELLIVDDCSADNSCELIEKYNDNDIKKLKAGIMKNFVMVP